MVALASVFVPVRPEFGSFARDAKSGLAAGFNAAEADARVAGAKAGRTFGKSVGDEGGKVMKGELQVHAQSAARMIGEAFAVEKGVEFLRDSVKAASDLYETSSKLNVLFGASGANSIETWAQAGAKAFGLSRQSAEDAAGQFGVFAQSAGLSGQASVDFAERLTGLTGDLTSFYNPAGGVAQATEAVGAALRGESEPIRQFGVLLDDATLRNQALQMGLITTTKQALTPQQRVLAAYQSILKQTGAAQGDFARTSDSFANRQRNLANQFEDTKVAVGQALLPVMTELMDLVQKVGLPAVQGLAAAFTHIPQPVFATALAITGVVGAVRVGQRAFEAWENVSKTVNLVLDQLAARAAAAAAAEGAQAAGATTSAAATSRMALAAQGAGASMGTLATRIGLASGVAGLGLLSDQVSQWSGNADVATVKTENLASSLTQMVQSGKAQGAVFDLANVNSMRSWAQNLDHADEAIQRFADEASGAFSMGITDVIGRAQSGSERLERFSATAKQLDAALAQMVGSGHGAEAKAFMDRFRTATGLTDEEFQHVTNRLPQYAAAVAQVNAANRTAATGAQQAAGAVHQQSVTLQSLLDKYPNFKDTVLQAAGASSTANAATVKLSAAQVHQVTTAVDLKTATDALTSSLDANKNATLALRGGETAWYAAVAQVSKAVKDNGHTLDVHSEKGRANRGVLDSLASAGLGYLKNIQENIGVGAQFKRTLDTQWRALYDAARRFGATDKEARNYADDIYKVPKALATKVTQPGMSKARADTQGLARDLSAIKSKTISVRVNSDGSFTEVWRTASGGVRSTTKSREGGAIHGGIPGAGDTVPAMLSHGEHVWTSREVNAAGGHGAVQRIRQAALDGTLAGFASGGPVLSRNWITNLSDRLPRGLAAGFDAGFSGVANRLANALGGVVAGGGAAGSGGPVPGGSGVNRWAPMVRRALAALGLPLSLTGNWLRQIATESGGNPNAIQGNIGDINNRTGDLAEGLVQVIGATFRAYHVAGTSTNRLDPWANLLAGMNYARHRYGSRMSAVIGHGHGYDAGGWLLPGQHGVNTSSRPERVLDGQQSERYMRGELAGPQVTVRVFIGDRELTDIVRVEIEDGLAAAGTGLANA